jgi:hypothetical protein
MTGPGQLAPIACRMDALTAAERARRSEVLALLLAQLASASETEDGIGFELRGGPMVPALAGEFVALEARCCPFIRFALEVAPEGGPVLLRLGGRPGVKEFLRVTFHQAPAPPE